jgi:hypothetical protein
LETKAQTAKTKARKLYGRQPMRTWFVMLDDNHWRAFVINTENKVALCMSPLAPSADRALDELNAKLDIMIRKTTKGRARKTP